MEGLPLAKLLSALHCPASPSTEPMAGFDTICGLKNEGGGDSSSSGPEKRRRTPPCSKKTLLHFRSTASSIFTFEDGGTSIFDLRLRKMGNLSSSIFGAKNRSGDRTEDRTEDERVLRRLRNYFEGCFEGASSFFQLRRMNNLPSSIFGAGN